MWNTLKELYNNDTNDYIDDNRNVSIQILLIIFDVVHSCYSFSIIVVTITGLVHNNQK